jgi:hypothetical protein
VLQYAERSLGCFRDTNPLRKRLVWVVESRPFEWVILAAICFNSILLGLVDYSELDSDGDPSPDLWRNHLISSSELCFTLLFTLEAVLKIAAMGFIGQHSYLRNPWNVIDFTVVVSGCVHRGVLSSPPCIRRPLLPEAC